MRQPPSEYLLQAAPTCPCTHMHTLTRSLQALIHTSEAQRTASTADSPGSDLPLDEQTASRGQADLDLQSLGEPQLQLGSGLGAGPQGKRRRGSGGPGWKQDPDLLPGGLPSPPGPQGCQDVAWPQPAPPTAGCPSKGSCHKQSAPLRGPGIWAGGPGEGLGKGGSGARVSLHRGKDSLAFTGGWH